MAYVQSFSDANMGSFNIDRPDNAGSDCATDFKISISSMAKNWAWPWLVQHKTDSRDPLPACNFSDCSIIANYTKNPVTSAF